MDDEHAFVRRVVVATAIVLALGGAAALVVAAFDVLLLVFAGVLVAVLLRGLAHHLAERTPLGPRASLAVTALALLALPALALWAFGDGIAEQTAALADALPKALADVRERLSDVGWIRWALDELPRPADMAPRADLLTRVTGFFSTTFGALANLLIVVVVGAYLAVEPGVYRDAVAGLFPGRKRHRVAAVMDEAASTLGWWLAGKFASMAIVGVLTGIGLALLGVPLAMPLALIAALLTFIPNFGPILSLIPAVLLAFAQSPSTALYVALLYAAVQFVETYLITPLIERKLVSLPPALTLVVQVLAGVLVGGLGLVLAEPLAVLAMLLVRRFYIEDVLDRRQEPLAPH